MPIDTQRRLVAIFAADVEGYGRLMGTDEVQTLRDLIQRRVILDDLIAAHRGRIANSAGDSVLAEFGSAVDAVQCAVEAQAALGKANEGVSVNSRINFRIGVHVGDVMVKGGDLFGDGVNIAARLEGIAQAGGVCISDDAQRQIRGKVDVVFDDMGLQCLKNISEPMRAWRARLDANIAPSAPPSHLSEQRLALTLPDKPSIAVLPFKNMSGDPAQDYFADGIVEDIITALSRVKWFFVIARNSSFTYKNRAVDVRQVGRELGVRYVLEGSIRKGGNRVRLTGQLLEAEGGRHIWGERFEGDLTDIFDLQDKITSSVVAAIEPTLKAAELERIRGKRTEDLGAYDLFLQALAELNRATGESLSRAEGLLRQALTQDPEYAEAWAALANTVHWRLVGGWLSLKEARPTGLEAAQLAVRTDPQNASALARAAAAMSVLGGDLDQAVEFADRALKLNRGSATVLEFAATVYNASGQFEDALPLLHEARRLSPLDPRGFVSLGQITASHFFLRRFDETIRWARRIVGDYPQFSTGWRYLAAALAHAGRLEEAHQAVVEVLRSQPNSNLARARTNNWRHPWMLDLYVEGLRLAGLPE